MEFKYGAINDPHLQVGKGSRDLLFKFWDPSISRERLELETSNLACRLITRGTNERNAKLRQRVQEGVTWPTFEILARERLELETSNSACQSKMPISVTINRSNRNREYNSNMAEVRFLKSELTQPWIELSYGNLILRETWTLLNECCYQNRSQGWISNSIWPQFLKF